ncbi:MAG: hypothetical protein IKU71_07295 [Kiritimatiellae bacterium]|nr:hypothetical protein [Kiritimatiellia bacterium]
MEKYEVGLLVLCTSALLMIFVPLILGILVSRVGNQNLRMALMIALLLSQTFVCFFVTKGIFASLAGNPCWDLCAQSFDVFLTQQHRLLQTGREDMLNKHIEDAYELRTHLMKGLGKDSEAFDFYERWESVINNGD